MDIFNCREIPIIEARYNGKMIGRFVNMNTATTMLKNKKNSVAYSFTRITEHDKDFWTLIRKGYVMTTPEITPEQKKVMLGLNLKDPDAIVKYIIEFYDQNGVKSEKELVEQLSEHKPLRTAIELQKEKVK